MLLSVVIPVRNEAGNIQACAFPWQAPRGQGEVEVIVVDGDSVDGTADLAMPLADRVLATASGRARQMNAGAAVARGRWLLFLHADTLMALPAIRELLGVLSSVAPPWGRFDVRLDSDRPLLRLIAAMMNLRSRCTGIATGDQAIFVRRDLFLNVGGFADIPLMEDIALSRRLKKFTRPYCPRCRILTSARRWQQQGAVATMVQMWLLRGAYAFGVSPDRLHRFYYPEQYRD